jgi:NAD(P)-dependent dehydrogenase (short-subunit alcohol dehydrogenase family)
MPLLAERASIIVTGSTTSVMGTPAFSVYSASKAAVRNLVRSWVLDLKGKAVRVNVLSPGPTQTPGLLALVPAEHQRAFLDSLASQVPLGRVGDPVEVANAALFLASDASSFVNGIELFVDGGMAQV